MTSQSLLAQLNLFFFRRERPYALALFRIVLPVVLLIDVLPRLFHVRELYSSDGAPAPLWEAYGVANMLPIPSPTWAMALYCAMVFCLITSCIGWKTRFSLFALVLLYPYFSVLDTLSTVTKFRAVATHLLLLLAVSDCGAAWSIDSWGQRKVPRVSAWPRRLIQLFIGIVYLGAAGTKTYVPAYFDGDQLTFWMLTNVNFPNPVGEYLSQFPFVVLTSAYLTLFWEVTFIFLSWKGWSRVAVISIGIAFHIMTILMLGLLIFPLLFCSVYLTFLHEEEARTVGQTVGRWFRWRPRWEWTQAFPYQGVATFAGALVVIMVVGVTAEARMDVYGEQRAEGRYQLKPLSEEEAGRLLRNDISVSAADNVFTFDVGTTLVSGLLANQKRIFHPGDEVIAEGRFVRPHADLWIEVMLRDVDGHTMLKDNGVLTREMGRMNFRFQLPESIAAGDYQFVLKIDNQAVMGRRIRVVQ